MGSVRPVNDAASPFKVLVVGGSYGGLAAAVNLSDLCQGRDARRGGENTCRTPIHVEITIVDERDGFYHVIGSPLVMASNTYANKAWIPYADLPALQEGSHIKTIHGSVTQVDLAAKTATIKKTAAAGATDEPLQFDFDFVIAASGLRRVFPVVPQSLTKSAYLAEVAPHVQSVTDAPDGVLVVGGGAVGIEMAAELKHVRPQLKVTLAHSRARLLSSEELEDVVAVRTLELLRQGGVEVLLEHRLKETKPVAGSATNAKEVVFTNGHTMRVNTVIMAISQSVPSSTYLPAEALAKDGCVKIRPSLFFPETVPNADCALAVGDLAAWTGIKRCGGAMHGGSVAAVNVHQRMQQELFGTTPKFTEIERYPPMIAIAVGPETVAFKNGGEVTTGPDVTEHFFQDDLGQKICYDIVGLGMKPGSTNTGEKK